MAGSCLGAQMYTVREFCKTAADFAQSCKKLRKIGYEAVQVSGIGKIDNAEVARILREEGLVCAATHVALELIQDTNRCVEHHQVLGCQYTALGSFKGAFVEQPSREEYETFAKEYSVAAKALAGRGVFAGYHNHAAEFTRVGDKLGLEVLIQKTYPSVWFELDTYWVAAGGGDPAQWIERVAGRIPCVHVKDMDIVPVQQQRMCEVGSGNLNWPRILEACKKAGVKWYLVERDTGALDPFESLKISLENLRAMGLR